MLRGILYSFAFCTNARKFELYFADLNGAIAPSIILNLGSGTTRFISMPIVLLNPWQTGQAPNGLLNEKNLGSGSSYLIPQHS